MKKKTIVNLLFLLILFFAVSCADSKWQFVNKINITKFSLNYIGFFNENFGIGVNGAYLCNGVYFTNDGGKTWAEGKNKSSDLYGIEIVNEKTAYACGNSRNVRFSRDGGKTWEAAKNIGDGEPNHCRYLSFLNPQTGWIASGELLASTTDGGNSWDKIDIPSGAGDIMAIDLSSGNTGYIFDSNGSLYKFSGNNTGWRKIAISGLNPADYLLMISGSPSVIVKFFDANNGMIILKQLKPEKALVSFSTKDGGKSWIKEKVADNKICGSNSNLYLSKDGNLLTIKNSGVVTLLKRK